MQSPNDLSIMAWFTFMRYKAALEVTTDCIWSYPAGSAPAGLARVDPEAVSLFPADQIIRLF